MQLSYIPLIFYKVIYDPRQSYKVTYDLDDFKVTIQVSYKKK